MTDKNLTEIVCIVDRSGSMNDIREDAIGGFNTFLKDQQEDPNGKCLLTYTQFDSEYEIVHSGIPIEQMKPLDFTTFVPRGRTALLDAIGRTLMEVGARLASIEEDKRPGNVIVVILTDGHENSSAEFSRKKVFDMVKVQAEDFNWKFIYLAQGIDAIAEGSSMGFDASHQNYFVANVVKGGKKFAASYGAVGKATSSLRGASIVGSKNRGFDSNTKTILKEDIDKINEEDGNG
jgi:hypothetical protein